MPFPDADGPHQIAPVVQRILGVEHRDDLAARPQDRNLFPRDAVRGGIRRCCRPRRTVVLEIERLGVLLNEPAVQPARRSSLPASDVRRQVEIGHARSITATARDRFPSRPNLEQSSRPVPIEFMCRHPGGVSPYRYVRPPGTTRGGRLHDVMRTGGIIVPLALDLSLCIAGGHAGRSRTRHRPRRRPAARGAPRLRRRPEQSDENARLPRTARYW